MTLCVCVCVCVCMCAGVCLGCVCMCLTVCIRWGVYMCAGVCVWCVHVLLCVHVVMCVSACVCVCVHALGSVCVCVWSYTHDVTGSQGISECLKSRHQDAGSLPAAPGALTLLILSRLLSFFGPHFHIFISLQPSSPLRAHTSIFKWTFSYPCSTSCCYITGNKNTCRYT